MRRKDSKHEMAIATNGTKEVLGAPTNDGEEFLSTVIPYRALVTIQGSAAILFHRWSNESIATKAAAAKGSRAKKTDDVQSYVYRLDNGNLALPGEYLRMSIVDAARFRQDPRSPRKSAMDLYKAGVSVLTEYADLGQKDWDYLDQRRVVVNRAGITRERPALRAGWKATIELLINVPEYITPSTLLEVINSAGRLIGTGDFRPTFGRYQATSFEVLTED
jgi:hypothetical protein